MKYRKALYNSDFVDSIIADTVGQYPSSRLGEPAHAGIVEPCRGYWRESAATRPDRHPGTPILAQLGHEEWAQAPDDHPDSYIG
jgi:hypothetical protein